MSSKFGTTVYQGSNFLELYGLEPKLANLLWTSGTIHGSDNKWQHIFHSQQVHKEIVGKFTFSNRLKSSNANEHEPSMT